MIIIINARCYKRRQRGYCTRLAIFIHLSVHLSEPSYVHWYKGHLRESTHTCKHQHKGIVIILSSAHAVVCSCCPSAFMWHLPRLYIPFCALLVSQGSSMQWTVYRQEVALMQMCSLVLNRYVTHDGFQFV